MPDKVTAATIRCRNDLKLYETLLADPLVQRVNERLARAEEHTPSGVRRRLLASSVRLSERMAPKLHATTGECIARLDMGIPVELYAFASPQFNAMCFKPEDGRLFVMFASSLLEAFDDAELKFVVGHELGHQAYRHHDVPVGYILRGEQKPPPGLALSLFAWSRYAEISCDRAGALCAQNPEAVARALFKLASGLSGRTIEFHMKDFLAQVDDMQVIDHKPGEGAPKEDWFATHPFSPLRVKALALFDRSEFVQSGGLSADQLEREVQELMGLMEPNYVQGKTPVAEAMRRLLFAGAVLIGNADGPMAPEEVALFERFFGAGSFKDAFDVDALEASLPERIRAVRERASDAQSAQVVRDLALLAKAEGHTTERECAVLERIARELGVGTEVIDQTLCAGLDPD